MAEREVLWEVLAEVFVDQDVDYAALADRLDGVAPGVLEHIFFDEVAPYCGANLLAPAPPVWTGFARESLIAGIRAEVQRREASRLRALAARLAGRYWRRVYAAEWRSLLSHLRRLS